jgi:hypothetical protein
MERRCRVKRAEHEAVAKWGALLRVPRSRSCHVYRPNRQLFQLGDSAHGSIFSGA